MTLGTILVSLAILLGVGAYVAWPFRRTDPDADIDRLVEAWVKRAQSPLPTVTAAQPMADEAEPPAEPAEARRLNPPAVGVASVMDVPVRSEEVINFCPYCGRKVQPDHAFCPKCGRQLIKEEAP